MPSSSTGKERLAKRALGLKKAWLLLTVMVGHRPSEAEALIPAYSSWNRRALQAVCDELESDVATVLALLTRSPGHALRPSSVRWLSEQFDRWMVARVPAFTISTVQQFEENVGAFSARNQQETPPYAEVYLQLGLPFAFRHPEYMLVRDLGMLLDLYRDAEALCDGIDPTNPPSWSGAAGENVQGLARSVIQACFNLLEAYVSGLARAHVMTQELPPAIQTRLTDNREPLKKRIRTVPSLIAGRESPLRPDSYPLDPLFNDIKRRRDAFVHCEPGPQDSTRGYVKEAVFHDIPLELVPLAVGATHEAIRQTWLFLYGVEGPRWLPPLESSGRFGKENLGLRPRASR